MTSAPVRCPAPSTHRVRRSRTTRRRVVTPTLGRPRLPAAPLPDPYELLRIAHARDRREHVNADGGILRLEIEQRNLQATLSILLQPTLHPKLTWSTSTPPSSEPESSASRRRGRWRGEGVPSACSSENRAQDGTSTPTAGHSRGSTIRRKLKHACSTRRPCFNDFCATHAGLIACGKLVVDKTTTSRGARGIRRRVRPRCRSLRIVDAASAAPASRTSAQS